MKNHFMLTPFFLDNEVSALRAFAKTDWAINDPDLPKGRTLNRMPSILEPISDFAKKCLDAGDRPVSIAGDCCSAIGFLAGVQQAGCDPLLIWFDAHGDFNTWETTPSGFLGGMPLAMIVGIGDQSISNSVHLKSLLEHNVILTDGRDLDNEERMLLERSNVRHLSQVDELLDYPITKRSIVVHFDTDVVSLSDSPAHNYPAKGGPSVQLMQSVFKRLASTQKIVGVSLSAWNFDLDKDKKSQTVSMSLLNTLLS